MADQYASDPSRDSHDLSLSPYDVTRDSLVNNMLLSLDQFSLEQKAASIGDPHGRPPLNYGDPARTWIRDAINTNASKSAARSSNARHHFPDYRSDLDAAAAAAAAAAHSDDSDSASLRVPRSRRTDTRNSSSSFRRPETGDSLAAGTARAIQSRGRDTAEKNLGGSNIVDSSEPSLWSNRRPFRRSVSLDQLYRRQGLPQHLPETLLSPLQTGYPPFPSSIDDAYSIKRDENDNEDNEDNEDDVDDDDDDGDDSSDYSAAPMPSVPGRSRRSPSDFHNPFPPLQRPEFPPGARERSTSRSLKSSSGPGRRQIRLRSMVPTMTLGDLDAAPAPSVGYGKSKAEQAAFNTMPKTPPQHRERSGFFRRVFGSRSSASTTPAEAQPTPRSVSSTLHQASTNSKSMAVASPRDVSTSHSGHHTLQKKPSSFFRRYIMGTTEELPPLPTEMPLPLQMSDAGVESDLFTKSPASSLRNVMNPYLSGGSEVEVGAAAENGACSFAEKGDTASNSSIGGSEKREFKRSFSLDYEPSPNAKIRAVTSDSDGEPCWETETSASQQAPRFSDTSAKRTSDSYMGRGSGSDDGELSPRSGGEAMRAGGTEESNDAAEAAGLSAIAMGGRDLSTTIRPSKKHTYKLDNSEADDESARLKLFIPGDRCTSFASGSTETDYKSAPSQPASVRIEITSNLSPRVMETIDLASTPTPDEPGVATVEPSEEDRIKAHQIFDGNEDFLPKERAAAWMGEDGLIRQRTLHAYMELFDFSDKSIVCAIRKVCSRLILRAETQQVDRILVAFSRRWCECNPSHGFKSIDVVHTICYSIMLLNTDLHIADIEQKMTRSQFVKNTISTILQTVLESDPDAFERPSILPEKSLFLNSGEPSRPSTEPDKKSFRNSFRTAPRAEAANLEAFDECGPLVKAPFYGSMKAWEEQVELSLKLAYASIRDECLPLFGGADPERLSTSTSLQGSLSVMGMLKRSPSVLSKAPSENFMSSRGRIAEGGRNSSARWTSRTRTRAGLGRPGFSSSRTSFDDAGSLWSPALSTATWSRYSLGRAHGSVSQESLGLTMPRGEFQQSIGFANALSQAIFREDDPTQDGLTSVLSADMSAPDAMLEDESLELSGPPWVKEGRVMHKHHLDGVGKRAKERNWNEVFAVIQKGHMSLFSFQNNKSTRKARSRNAGKLNGPVGGGNWQDNAVQLCSFNLRLTLASALPSPGYSRSRPFVWALSLPTGAVHLFQVGTPEIIQEFVDTANYWSARLSTHPLIGGISNMEYGWGESVVNAPPAMAMGDPNANSAGRSDRTSRPGSSATTHGRKASVQSAVFQTASLDQGSSSILNNSKGKPPGDRIHISDWTPPTQSMRPSSLPETEQHNTLAAYVKGLEEELQMHNQLRSPMLLAYSARSLNAVKANANWERKSAYLLREIVKFRTYVDALAQAANRKREIYDERDAATRAAQEEYAQHDEDSSGEEDEEDEGDETLKPS